MMVFVIKMVGSGCADGNDVVGDGDGGGGDGDDDYEGEAGNDDGEGRGSSSDNDDDGDGGCDEHFGLYTCFYLLMAFKTFTHIHNKVGITTPVFNFVKLYLIKSKKVAHSHRYPPPL